MPVTKTSTKKRARSFSERDLATTGVVGTIVLGAVLALALNLGKLPVIGGGEEYTAYFSDAGSLASGDDVLVAGLRIGQVSEITLDGTRVAVQIEVSDKNVSLGDRTRAAIITETVLGKAAVRLDPAGRGDLDAPIPLARTAPQYDITAALDDLTGTTQAIDVAGLSDAIDTVNATFAESPEELHAALTGIASLSDTIATRDAGIRDLLASAESVTGLLKDRNEQISVLLADGAALLAVVDARKQQITKLLENTTALANALQQLVRTHQKKLGPALEGLNETLRLLNKNKVNLEKSIKGLNAYASTLGNAVSSGPYFDGYVSNLTSPSSLVPILSDIMAGESR